MFAFQPPWAILAIAELYLFSSSMTFIFELERHVNSATVNQCVKCMGQLSLFGSLVAVPTDCSMWTGATWRHLALYNEVASTPGPVSTGKGDRLRRVYHPVGLSLP